MERIEKRLYDALVKGDLTILQMLIQEDPLILDKVTLNHYDDMPLHMASMLGHIDFVKEILIRKPELSMECDSQRRLPLHIAAAKGHLEIVKALVSANSETCLARDCDGRNAIHVAAIRGRYKVVKELMQAQPHAARAMVQHDTILHLCVKYNQLEVLKFLVETISDHEFLNSRDADGNTILHLAAAQKRIETINFLERNPTMEVNALNKNGETSNDVKVKEKSRNDNNLENRRNTLMLVATFVAAMAFQSGTNPPGGVWQDASGKDDPLPHHKAGHAVMITNNEPMYHTFLFANAVGFVSTLSIVLLLISGLHSLKDRVFLRIITGIMWMATISMSIAYTVSIWALSPEPRSTTVKRIVVCIVGVWAGVMYLIYIGHTDRLIAMIKNYSKKRSINSKPVVKNQGEFEL